MIFEVKGQRVTIDDEDWEWVQQRTWHLFGSRSQYIGTREKRQTRYLHRMITKAPTGKEVDHINRDTFDNRRSNLRVVTSTQNKFNTSRMGPRNQSSGVRGVTWSHSMNQWRARISVQGKEIRLGFFPTIKLAQAARQAAENRFAVFDRVAA